MITETTETTETEASVDNETAAAVAREILRQMGVRLQMELAVKKRVAITSRCGGLALELAGARETRGKYVTIVLEATDLYTVSVFRAQGLRHLDEVKVSDIGCEELAQTIRGLVFDGR